MNVRLPPPTVRGCERARAQDLLLAEACNPLILGFKARYKIPNHLYLISELVLGQARVSSQEKRLVHYFVRPLHFAFDPKRVGAVFFELHKNRLSQQIPAEKHPVADFIAVEVGRQIRMAKPCPRLDPDHEAKPGSIGAAPALVPGESSFEVALATPLVRLEPCGSMGWQGELEHFVQIRQARAKNFPVALPGLDEIRQLFELASSDGSLRIERLQVVAKVAVNIFMVVSFGQFSKLPAKPLPAGVILAGSAPTVPAPIAETFGISLEWRPAHDVDGATFPHSQVMRGIERLRGKIAPCPGVAGDVCSVLGYARRIFRDT